MVACAILLCGPLLAHGSLPRGSDVFATSHYLQGFMKAFGEGDLLPRWIDRSNQDMGSPAFVLFPPLTFYGAGAASWLTGSGISGLRLYLVALALLTAGAFLLLARGWIGTGLPAAIATGIYMLLPYHVLDMYQRFAMSETTSFLFFPLLLLFARRVLDGGAAWSSVALALSYAGLIGTHLVSAFLFSLMLGLWILWEGRGRWRAIARPVLALVGGLGLSAPVLLPAVVEKSSANIAWVREAPNGDFRINFIFKDDPLPGLGFKDPVKPPVLRAAHSQLALAGVAAGLGLLWLPREAGRRRRDVLVLVSACALAYLLQLEISMPVWEIVPELATIQFPWRFQVVMVLTSAMLVGHAIAAAQGKKRGTGRVPGLLLLAGLVALNMFHSYQNAFLKPFDYDESFNQRPTVVHWIEPSTTPVGFEPYKRFKQMKLDLERAAFVEGQGSIRVAVWESSRRVLEVESPAGGEVMLRAFWFPGWTGTLSGVPLELEPSTPYGAITFEVPSGAHTVTLDYGATPVRRAAGFIGLASVFLTPLLAWRLSRTVEARASGAERSG